MLPFLFPSEGDIVYVYILVERKRAVWTGRLNQNVGTKFSDSILIKKQFKAQSYIPPLLFYSIRKEDTAWKFKISLNLSATH
jgi:hypothetical protein